ncbi:MAG: membrane protein insertase YidC [Desulfobulbaceae bacterium]|nr:membrane protein insertase YidC [Desulfobulbaceae bacterium]HIJ90271.1 membrane protein insertase YidC [Deltaproteobacteria bacterium]
MDTQRIFLAIFLSLAILLGYQYFFVPSPSPVTESIVAPSPENGKAEEKSVANGPAPVAAASLSTVVPADAVVRQGRDIPVTTSLYSAVVTETGGMVKSFRLKNYREDFAKDSGNKELLRPKSGDNLPLNFSWGVEPGNIPPVVYESAPITQEQGGDVTLTMRGKLSSGLEIVRTMRFLEQQYLVELTIDVVNPTATPLQGAPYLTLDNRPFSNETQMVFVGPAVLRDGVLEEINSDDLKKGSKSFTGKIGWAAYEDNYFFCGIVPRTGEQHTANFTLQDDNRVNTVLAGASDVIQPGQRQQYSYSVYFGPKTMGALKSAGHELERSINFGWFDVMAKPTLYLLNFLHGYVGNYGLAIILVTVLIKLLFWPVSQKGMKSMKTMQKLQPKMAKLREKFKDDKQLQQQEMIKLYQTYKVNPVGGCLPMVIQIPVFFALYKVLLQTIELRHAPFFLWITDLSAPDRLSIGFNLPFVGGIPVLTLLMGATMFLQQKMTPSTGDPTQQKVMMFMPVIFTFMFLNFASGLVLYWFVNNLLSIGQQYLVNRHETA